MKREDISQDQYNRILECFIQALVKNGLKGTTMDSIAANLQMSKRSLYEIFGNKEEMFREAHKYFHKQLEEKLTRIFASSSNLMEAIIKCFLYNRNMMSKLSADFIRDLEEYATKEKIISDNDACQHHHNLFDVVNRGVAEGYFRNDINLLVQCRMLSLQMEALKRSEELFPEDISLLEIYDSIIIGFLRGISSQKGLDELEKFMPTISQLSSNLDNL